MTTIDAAISDTTLVARFSNVMKLAIFYQPIFGTIDRNNIAYALGTRPINGPTLPTYQQSD